MLGLLTGARIARGRDIEREYGRMVARGHLPREFGKPYVQRAPRSDR
jgi:hypothetical protein